jgi:2-polyprenyl-3-methyl-5-hydroxy-6-metoxy-1,4-benzoquinol methylase
MTQMTADEFAEQLFGSVLGALDVWAIYLGDKLGLYRTIADQGPVTESDLATKAGIHERYAREWLEHQTVAGVLEVDDPAVPAPARRYSLPPAQAEVLTDPDSLAYLTPFARLIVAAGLQLPALLDAYRTGGGVSWAEFGSDMRTGQAEMNRPWFMSELGTTWFPTVPHLQARLEGGARIADFGCGEGWSSIAMAKAYPNVTVDGFDIDGPSIEEARRHAEAEGVADRVSFDVVDAGSGVEGSYDVVTAFECIHDLTEPVSVLGTMHQAAAEDGIVVVMDEAVGDRFGERTDEVERLMYGFSIFICLPDGMSHDGSAATGTVMRPSTLEAYARAAGFSGVEVLPIENDLWRFYELKT